MKLIPMKHLPGLIADCHGGKEELYTELTRNLENFYEHHARNPDYIFKEAESLEGPRIDHLVFDAGDLRADQKGSGRSPPGKRSFPAVRLTIDGLVENTKQDYGDLKDADFAVTPTEIKKSSCRLYFNYCKKDKGEATRLGTQDRDEFIRRFSRRQ